MRIKQLLITVVIALATTMVFDSCATKQHAISRLERFSYELRDNGAYYSYQDWKDAAEEFVDIRKDINRHEYNAEQRKEIGQLEGKCAGYLAKGLKDRVNNLGSEIKGVLQGILDSIIGE